MTTPKETPVLDPETTSTQGLQPTRAQTPARLGIAPTSVEEGWRLAQMMAKSELVPKGFRGRPEDVIVAIQMGVEIGLAPMQALQSIAVINGRPGVWGDGLLALIMASSVYADHDEYYEVNNERRDRLTAEDLKQDTTCAVCTFVRRGKATPLTRRFSVAQAKKAGLVGKAGPWVEYPDRMLSMRARSFAARDCFPDVLRGVRTAEELRDNPLDEDVTLPPVVREVKRVSETIPAPPVQAAATTTALGPLSVQRIVAYLGGYTAVLGDGLEVDVDEADAQELEKFIGSTHRVRLACTRVADRWQLVSFAIED